MKLRPYQIVGIHLIEKFNGRVLLADEQGLGKTLQILEWLRRHPEKRPAIIVCPASVKYVWEDQAREHCNLKTVICQSQTPKNLNQDKRAKRAIFIINYDILLDWCKCLRALHPKVVVFDEVQKIKNRGTIRTRAARLLCAPTRKIQINHLHLTDEESSIQEDSSIFFKDKDGHRVSGFIQSLSDTHAVIKTQVKHVMGLSGTPLTNHPAELWSTLNLIWPQEFPAFTPFAWSYCNPELTPYGWKYTGASHLGKLHRVLKQLGMIRRLKQDVAKDLPEKQITVVPMDITNRKEYNEALNNFINWLTRQDAARAERASKAIKITQISYLKRLAAAGKLKGIFNWIDSFLEESDSKLVLGCLHHDIIKAIHQHYPQLSVVFTGKTPPDRRRAAIMDFRKNPRRRLFIGQIYAAGLGVDGLQEVAHTSAVLELPWDPGTLSQFFDRIHRIGQNKKVNIYILAAKNTLEEKLCQLLQMKQDVLTHILDGKDLLSKRRLDIYDQLEQEILKDFPSR